MQVNFVFFIVIYTQNIKIITLLGYCLQLLAFTGTLHLKGRGFISSDLKGSLFLFHEVFPLTPSKPVSINTLCNINYVFWEGLCPEFIAFQQYCWITMLVFWVWKKRLFQPLLIRSFQIYWDYSFHSQLWTLWVKILKLAIPATLKSIYFMESCPFSSIPTV